jgi:sugar/nucleoside kinase (ribokinase family)
MGIIGAGLLAVGHVLLDYVGKASDEAAPFLKNLPSPAHVDAAAMAEIVKALANKDGQSLWGWRSGGGATLTAKTWARLGLPAVLVGCVGHDEGAALLRQELGAAFPGEVQSQAGIQLKLFESDKPTGRFCFLDTPQGKKIIASPSAARDVRRFDIPEKYFIRGWVLHIDGLLIDALAWLERHVKRAKSAGMVVSMDLSTSFNAARRGKELFSFAEYYCDVVFANEKEWEALNQVEHPWVFSNSGTIWVVKRGKRGASALENSCWIDKPVAQIIELNDDVGAGDAFAAGFLAARMKGESTMNCLAGGNESAAGFLSQRR